MSEISFFNKNNLVLKGLVHLFVWVLLFSFPFFLSQSPSSTIDYMRLLKYTWLPLCFYAILFYVNYLYLIKRFLFPKSYLPFIFVNLILILLFTWIHFEIKEFLNMAAETRPPGTPSHLQTSHPPLQFFIYKNIISMIIPVIIAFSVKTNEEWTKTESEKKEKEKEILNSELQNLKYQLQPHFFFNSLNTIYALIERSPVAAQETVHSLGKLMRYMLYETESGKVNLKEEIEFMKQYIDLMKLRLSDKTKVSVMFPSFSENLEITPFLFIPLIENAFKHGISATQTSDLFFSLTITETTIRFFSENTSFPKDEKDKSGSGIGLLNLKKRIELSYPGKYTFEAKQEGNCYRALLEIHIAPVRTRRINT